MGYGILALADLLNHLWKFVETLGLVKAETKIIGAYGRYWTAHGYPLLPVFHSIYLSRIPLVNYDDHPYQLQGNPAMLVVLTGCLLRHWAPSKLHLNGFNSTHGTHNWVFLCIHLPDLRIPAVSIMVNFLTVSICKCVSMASMSCTSC